MDGQASTGGNEDDLNFPGTIILGPNDFVIVNDVTPGPNDSSLLVNQSLENEGNQLQQDALKNQERLQSLLGNSSP